MKTYTWKHTDPRIDVYRNTRILILRPTINGDWESCIGTAESSDNHWISARFDNELYILSVNDKWNESWRWTYLPPMFK